MRTYFLVALFAYFCGSIPFGYILVRTFRGADIRQSGSGNIGATNVARTAPGLGVATLALDCLKGFAAVTIATAMFAPEMPMVPYVGNEDLHMAVVRQQLLLACMAAFFAICGHVFPVWLKFRGGKGVATGMGAFLGVAPPAVGISLLLFFIVVAATRYVSLGSLVGTAAFPVSAGFLNFRESSVAAMAFITAGALLIIAKHRQNIRRLLSGSERRLGKDVALQAAGEDGPGRSCN